MTDELIKTRKDDATGSIILQRPDKRNALSREMISRLQTALHDLHMEYRVRAVVLTGSGDTFCAGLDLAEILATSQSKDPLPQWHTDARQLRDLLVTMLQFPKPIIAAVNGPALAAGAGLVLASDIVIASEKATFGFPEPRRGLVAGILAPLLNFRIAGGPAANLLLTSRQFDSEDAYRFGVFHELVSDDLVWARANRIAGDVARGAPEAIALTKRMLNETIGEQLSTLLTAGAAVSATARTTEAASEGVAAFLEKRDPAWP